MTREFEATSELQPLDSARVLAALEAHGVDYLLIGGLAALAHGSTMAGPVDVVLTAAGVGSYAQHGTPDEREAFGIRVLMTVAPARPSSMRR